jgi:hypothetical protein
MTTASEPTSCDTALIASQFINRKVKEAECDASSDIDEFSIRQIVNGRMNPYAKPSEKKVRENRPKISHLPTAAETRTRQERLAEKQAVAAERRAIKKSARRHLKQELDEELAESD